VLHIGKITVISVSKIADMNLSVNHDQDLRFGIKNWGAESLSVD
jgi:hypothetical protein